MMKWLLFGAGAVCAVGGILAAVKARKRPASTDEIDGGVRHYESGDDYPKKIESNEITDFNCTFSLVAIAEECSIEKGVYKLKAELKDGVTVCSVKWHDRMGNGDNRTFETDSSFMKDLQEIVSNYDFAKHNGYSYRVSGLPDMYGAYLSVGYASGESIYAHDNQSNFLPLESLEELFSLFTSQNQK